MALVINWRGQVVNVVLGPLTLTDLAVAKLMMLNIPDLNCFMHMSYAILCHSDSMAIVLFGFQRKKA